MSELEIYLMSSLQNIVDLHNLPNDRPCKCMQCKIARQAIKHAQLRVKPTGDTACVFCNHSDGSHDMSLHPVGGLR